MHDPTTPPETGPPDALLRLLADSERRRIINQLRATNPTAHVTLEELTSQLTTDTEHDPDHTRIRLHHTHLPKLADIGLIDYDPATNTIAYHGHDALEVLLDTIPTQRPP